MKPTAGLSLEDAALVDEWCDAFEVAWQASDGRVHLEEWIERAPAHLRATFFTELLAMDGQLRQQQVDGTSQFLLSEVCPFDIATVITTKDAKAEVSTRDVRRSLLGCPTFAGLSPIAAEMLEDSLQEKKFVAGDTLLREGQPAAGLFVVVSGQLEIRKDNSGAGRVLDRVGAGSVMGEMSLLTGQPCTATVVAKGDVTALRLSVTRFGVLRKEFPELEIVLSQLVSDRLGRREVDALCGRVLSGYQLRRCISRGGMGVIYESHRESHPEQRVAIKMLRHRFAHEKSMVEHFQREAEVLRRFCHPNLISVHDSFVDFRTRFLVMQLCDGYDLARVLSRKGPLKESVVRGLLGQITAGLNYVHRNGVVHLDLKPQNVLIYRDGTAAVADFGLCQILGVEGAADVIKGTPAYMPPEQLRGASVDASGDWYAVACMTYELLTGKKLFSTQDLFSLLVEKEMFAPEQIPDAGGLSHAMRELIVNAIHPEPERRKWNAEEIQTWSRLVPELMN